METLAPVIITIFVFTCIVIIVGGFILARHKERMSLIEKGMTLQDLRGELEAEKRYRHPLRSLMWGFVFVAIGLAILVGMAFTEWYHFDDGIFPALITLFGGIALVVYYTVASKKQQP